MTAGRSGGAEQRLTSHSRLGWWIHIGAAPEQGCPGYLVHRRQTVFEGWILVFLKLFYQFHVFSIHFCPFCTQTFKRPPSVTCITLPPVIRCEEARQLRSLRTRIKIISDRGASAGSGDQRRYWGAGQKWLVYDDGFNLQTREQCSLCCWCAEYTAAAGVAEIPKS